METAQWDVLPKKKEKIRDFCGESANRVQPEEEGELEIQDMFNRCVQKDAQQLFQFYLGHC